MKGRPGVPLLTNHMSVLVVSAIQKLALPDQREQDKVDAQRHQVDQRLLATVLGREVRHVVPLGLVLWTNQMRVLSESANQKRSLPPDVLGS